jgi:hypothetical protein
MDIKTYITQEGKILKTDNDFEAHKTLSTSVDVEHWKEDGLIMNGLIQEFSEQSVKINDHQYNRNEHIFTSKPFSE